VSERVRREWQEREREREWRADLKAVEEMRGTEPPLPETETEEEPPPTEEPKVEESNRFEFPEPEPEAAAEVEPAAVLEERCVCW
jgi:hypothetical protein